MEKERNFRVANVDDVEDILSLSTHGQFYEPILKYRFSDLKSLFTDLGYPEYIRGACVCSDASNAMIGWACCFRFNQRAGYSGVAQLVMDVDQSHAISDIADGLYALCKEESRRLEMHTIVSFAHDAMTESLTWHHENAFEMCGGIQVGDAEKMLVFSKKIR